MAILKDILYKVSIDSVSGSTDIPVENIAFDSRKVTLGTCFIAVKGTQVDGHSYITTAIRSGATSIICEQLPKKMEDSITYVSVKNSAEALGIVAANFYENPSKKITLIGVTGTNGKTTICTLLHGLFTALGYKTGLISTIENKIDDEVIQATHTTPDAIALNQLLTKMITEGCTHCFMEVSSHALEQCRVAGVHFTGAIFSNISHDHLDYHKTFDAYIGAKKKLFDNLSPSAFALVNIDDKRGLVMLQNTKALKSTFSLKSASEFKAKIITDGMIGLELEIEGRQVWFKIIGDFNAYNLLAAFSCAVNLGEDPDEVLTTLSTIGSAAGRFELVENQIGLTAIVDYAHTPDALKNVLETITQIRSRNEQVITVIGCGGDRDKAKRPLMASIACQYSDKVVLTSDNPRNEKPEDILNEMKTGIRPSDVRKTLMLLDREEAIKTACLMASKKDIILVAGKGHETYQEINGVRLPFDDKEVLKRMLNLMSS